MRTLSPYLALIGWIITIVAQLYIVVQAFRVSPLKGFLCLLIPGYILYFGTTKNTRQTKALILWGIGLLLFIVGLVTS
jgi:predicted Kef-type K+ transport protein